MVKPLARCRRLPKILCPGAPRSCRGCSVGRIDGADERRWGAEWEAGGEEGGAKRGSETAEQIHEGRSLPYDRGKEEEEEKEDNYEEAEEREEWEEERSSPSEGR